MHIKYCEKEIIMRTHVWWLVRGHENTVLMSINIYRSFESMYTIRVGSIRYKKRKDRFNMMPILKEGMGQPASLCSYNTRVNTLQEELCSTTNVKGMACHLRKTGCNPYCITIVHKPGLGHCKGNLTIEHNAQILARGIQSILDKYNTAEGCIPCKGDPKRKL